MYVVGLTGGIGAGKSTAVSFFSRKGIPVYDSDLSAKILMEQVEQLKMDIIKDFGKQVYRAGRLDTKYLSQKIFGSPMLMRRLNALVHPWVFSDFKSWMCRNQALYCIKETAILFESGAHQLCDLIITVTAPQEERIKRIIQRDQSDRTEVLSRIKSQWVDPEKISRSDFIIQNIKNIEVLKQTIQKIHDKIPEKLRKKTLLL